VPNHVLYKSYFVICCCLGLIACDSKSPLEEPVSTTYNDAIVSREGDGDVFPATKLRDAVSQMSHAINTNDKLMEVNVTDEALPFVGRYKTNIDCMDKIINCDGGQANVILNLLPDGTAHSSIIHLGQISYSPNLQYARDLWYFDPEENEIVLERSSGVTFFFKADQSNKLIMDSHKVKYSTPQNREFFDRGNPEPARDYVLIKEKKI